MKQKELLDKYIPFIEKQIDFVNEFIDSFKKIIYLVNKLFFVQDNILKIILEKDIGDYILKGTLYSHAERSIIFREMVNDFIKESQETKEYMILSRHYTNLEIMQDIHTKINSLIIQFDIGRIFVIKYFPQSFDFLKEVVFTMDSKLFESKEYKELMKIREEWIKEKERSIILTKKLFELKL